MSKDDEYQYRTFSGTFDGGELNICGEVKPEKVPERHSLGPIVFKKCYPVTRTISITDSNNEVEHELITFHNFQSQDGTFWDPDDPMFDERKLDLMKLEKLVGDRVMLFTEQVVYNKKINLMGFDFQTFNSKSYILYKELRTLAKNEKSTTKKSPLMISDYAIDAFVENLSHLRPILGPDGSHMQILVDEGDKPHDESYISDWIEKLLKSGSDELEYLMIHLEEEVRKSLLGYRQNIITMRVNNQRDPEFRKSGCFVSLKDKYLRTESTPFSTAESVKCPKRRKNNGLRESSVKMINKKPVLLPFTCLGYPMGAVERKGEVLELKTVYPSPEMCKKPPTTRARGSEYGWEYSPDIAHCELEEQAEWYLDPFGFTNSSGFINYVGVKSHVPIDWKDVQCTCIPLTVTVYGVPMMFYFSIVPMIHESPVLQHGGSIDWDIVQSELDKVNDVAFSYHFLQRKIELENESIKATESESMKEEKDYEKNRKLRDAERQRLDSEMDALKIKKEDRLNKFKNEHKLDKQRDEFIEANRTLVKKTEINRLVCILRDSHQKHLTGFKCKTDIEVKMQCPYSKVLSMVANQSQTHAAGTDLKSISNHLRDCSAFNSGVCRGVVCVNCKNITGTTRCEDITRCKRQEGAFGKRFISSEMVSDFMENVLQEFVNKILSNGFSDHDVFHRHSIKNAADCIKKLITSLFTGRFKDELMNSTMSSIIRRETSIAVAEAASNQEVFLPVIYHQLQQVALTEIGADTLGLVDDIFACMCLYACRRDLHLLLVLGCSDPKAITFFVSAVTFSLEYLMFLLPPATLQLNSGTKALPSFHYADRSAVAAYENMHAWREGLRMEKKLDVSDIIQDDKNTEPVGLGQQTGMLYELYLKLLALRVVDYADQFSQVHVKVTACENRVQQNPVGKNLYGLSEAIHDVMEKLRLKFSTDFKQRNNEIKKEEDTSRCNVGHHLILPGQTEPGQKRQ